MLDAFEFAPMPDLDPTNFATAFAAGFYYCNTKIRISSPLIHGRAVTDKKIT